MPVAEANTIIARWRADSYLAFLEIDFNREPSSGQSSRTNTSGGRIATSTVVMVPNSLRTASFRSNVYGRPTSRVRVRVRVAGRGRGAPSCVSHHGIAQTAAVGLFARQERRSAGTSICGGRLVCRRAERAVGGESRDEREDGRG